MRNGNSEIDKKSVAEKNKDFQEILGLDQPIHIERMSVKEFNSLLNQHRDSVIAYLNKKKSSN